MEDQANAATAQAELPRYKSHKTVRALEIAGVNGQQLTFIEKFAPITVDPKVFGRYTPVAGDFYVIYDDNYVAISPRTAFLGGYTPVGADAKHEGLPVAGYKPQGGVAVDLVNQNKRLEENVLRVLDDLATMKGPAASNDVPSELTVDQRWLAIGRTAIEQGFMAVNRAVFMPGRVKLAGDRLPA